MDETDIILSEQDFGEEPYRFMLEEIFEHAGNDCPSLHKFFETRGEVRRDNLEWLLQHPMPNRAICSAFVAFFNHFVDNSWLDLFWKVYIDGHDQELNEQKYCNKVFYAATELVNAYNSGISFDSAKECCAKAGDMPSHLSMLLHALVRSPGENYHTDPDMGSNNPGNSISVENGEVQGNTDADVIKSALELEQKKNEQFVLEIKNLNMQMGEYLMQIAEKDDRIQEITKQRDMLQNRADEMDDVIAALKEENFSLREQIEELRLSEETACQEGMNHAYQLGLWSKHCRRKKLKAFSGMEPLRQREEIVKLVLEGLEKSSGLSIVNQLLEDKRISNEFLYTYLLDHPGKGGINDLRLLCGDVEESSSSNPERKVVPNANDKDKEDVFQPEEKTVSGEAVHETNIIVETSDEEENEDDYY